jgi:hypothetical protein
MEERDILLDKKLDRIIELNQEQIELMKLLTADRCTCKKHRKREKKDKERKKRK